MIPIYFSLFESVYGSFFLLKNKKYTKLIVYWHIDITKQKTLGKQFCGQDLALFKKTNKIVGLAPMHINESAYTKCFGNKKLLLYMIDKKNHAMSEIEIKKAERIREQYKKNDRVFIGRHVAYKGLKYLIEA